MTARALIKSPTAQRSSPSSTSPGGSTPQLPNQSVQADGMRDRLPSGSTTNNNGTPCRVSPLITARRHPSKGCRLRVMTTEVGKSWEWVVCGVFFKILRTSVAFAKAGMFSRRKACRGKNQNPVVWIAGWRETKTLKPIDNVSRGEATSHRAVTIVNAKVASKMRSPEGRAPNRRAKAAWGAEI